MSLLDDVSIVVTPNGYKAGELYAVVPEPTEGAEILSQPVDLVTDFLVNSGGVIVDADTFTTAGGTFDGIRKNNFLTAGTRYKLIIEGNTTSSGFTIGETTISGNEYGSGFGTHYFTAIGTGSIWLRQQTAGTTNITSFSIKEYTSADMDVTRETAATRVDEDGLVNYAEVIGDELVTNGDFATDTDWTKGTGITIAGGVALFTSVSSGLQLNQVTLTAVTGKRYKISYEIKTRTEGAFSASIGGTLSLNQNSEVGVYTEYLTAIGAGSFYIRSRGTTSGSIDNVSVKEVTRDNVPRIDYTGGGCPHILAEPMRTNLITYSEDFTNWSIARATLGTNITAPNGETDGYSIIATTVNDDHFVYKSISVVNTNVYTYSAYLKKGSKSWARLWNTSVGYADFDLENGVVGTQSSVVGSIDLLNNGWYRCSIVYTAVSTGNDSHRIYTLDGDNDKTFLGDGSTINLYTFGAQLEESYLTSYIPTSGSTVTRNQDIFTRDGIGSLINDSEGVLFVEIAALADDGTVRYIALSDGSNNERVQIIYSTTANNIAMSVVSSNSAQASFTAVISQTQYNKIAIKYKENDCSFWLNGVKMHTDTSATMPSGLDTLGFERPTGVSQFYGKVKQLQVYDTALTDEQLLQLTGTSGTDFYESYAEMASALTYTIQ
jgi:hypothetical protein